MGDCLQVSVLCSALLFPSQQVFCCQYISCNSTIYFLCHKWSSSTSNGFYFLQCYIKLPSSIHHNIYGLSICDSARDLCLKLPLPRSSLHDVALHKIYLWRGVRTFMQDTTTKHHSQDQFFSSFFQQCSQLSGQKKKAGLMKHAPIISSTWGNENSDAMNKEVACSSLCTNF